MVSGWNWELTTGDPGGYCNKLKENSKVAVRQIHKSHGRWAELGTQVQRSHH